MAALTAAAIALLFNVLRAIVSDSCDRCLRAPE